MGMDGQNRKSRNSCEVKIVVRVTRDPAIEALVLVKNGDIGECFVCGRDASSGDESRRPRRHEEEKKYFKALLINRQVRGKMSPKVYKQFMDNSATCVTCLAIINQVWTFRKEMDAIQKDLDQLVEEARRKTIKKIPPQKRNVQIVQIQSGHTSRIKGITTARRKVELHQKELQVPEDEDDDSDLDFEGEDTDSENGMEEEMETCQSEVEVKNKEETEDGTGGVSETDCPHSLRQLPPRQRRNMKLIISRKLTARSLVSVRSCGRRKAQIERFKHADTNKIETTATFAPKRRNAKVKTANKLELPKFNTRGDRLYCFKCGIVLKLLSLRMYHEVEVCKIRYNKKYLNGLKSTFYKCSTCDRFCSSKSDLRLHILAHQGVKPFHCPRCRRGFTTKTYLITHYINQRCNRHPGRPSKLSNLSNAAKD